MGLDVQSAALPFLRLDSTPGLALVALIAPVFLPMIPSNVLIVTPGSAVRSSGNRCTASQWAGILRRMGSAVRICYDVPECLPVAQSDLLIVMHAVKCAPVIPMYRRTFPRVPILLALTGTDIYPDPGAEALASMREADGLVALQEKALEKIPPDLRHKVSVVIQSASPPASRAKKPAAATFDVCVVGHLREVKDPMLTPRASRLVPAKSRLRVRHAGGILEARFGAEVANEQSTNPRYEWLGELSPSEVADLLASSQVMAITSRSEGGARVVSEAVMADTPVISTRVDGVVGLLGEDYPGFFPVGEEEALAALLWRCESDLGFFDKLVQAARAMQARFHPEAEADALVRAVLKLAR